MGGAPVHRGAALSDGRIRVGAHEMERMRRPIMKRMASRFPYPPALAVAVVALLATITLASARSTNVEKAEARKRELHAKLNITPAHEDLWTNVAQVMRDNAQAMDALTQARSAQAPAMTAIDDLKSYSDIA